MTDEIEVLTAAEVPNNPHARRIGRIYPFPGMEVGHAFMLPSVHRGAGCAPNSPSPRVACAASVYGQRHGVKFSCIRQTCGGVRVERIA